MGTIELLFSPTHTRYISFGRKKDACYGVGLNPNTDLSTVVRDRQCPTGEIHFSVRAASS